MAEGFAVWPELRDHIREYAGLTVRFIRHGSEDKIWFDMGAASKWADVMWVRKHYEHWLGSRLAPIGYSNHDHQLLLLAESGRVFGTFGTFDNFVEDLGGSIAEAVGNIMEGGGREVSHP